MLSPRKHFSMAHAYYDVIVAPECVSLLYGMGNLAALCLGYLSATYDIFDIHREEAALGR